MAGDFRAPGAAGGVSYFDYQATTPLAPEALAAMMPYLTDKFGNPHSAGHRYGWEAKAGIDIARKQVAALVNAPPESILFTAGATEANTLALAGAVQASGRNRLVTVATEHACVLGSAEWLSAQGVDVVVLPVGADGLLDPVAVRAAITPATALVSVMLVNNEIGVVQPVAAIAAIAHTFGALMHCDAAQAAGKLPVDVAALGVDLMSLSAHKMYGPKGIGALYRRPGVPLVPQTHGGGQEAGVRSGTQSPALAAGFGAAAKLAGERLGEDLGHVRACATMLLETLQSLGVAYRLNGAATPRYEGNLNLCFPGADGDRLLAGLRGFAVSSGAACASGSGKPSHVLAALGLPRDLAKASLRIGFGRNTTLDEVRRLAEALHCATQQARVYGDGAFPQDRRDGAERS